MRSASHRSYLSIDTHAGHLEESVSTAEDVGARAWVAASLRDLGYLALRDKQWPIAPTRLSEAMGHFEALGDREGVARCLEGMAGSAGSVGREDEAARIWAYARQLKESTGPPTTPGSRDDLRLVEDLLMASDISQHAEPAGSIPTALDLIGRLAEPRGEAKEHAPRLEVAGLGPVEVFRDGRKLQTADWAYAKPRQLLFFLLEEGPRSRDEIGLVFWPEASQDQVRSGVRSALYHLRQALGGREWVGYGSGRYRFNPEGGVWYDVEEFERILSEAEELRDGGLIQRHPEAVCSSRLVPG